MWRVSYPFSFKKKSESEKGAALRAAHDPLVRLPRLRTSSYLPFFRFHFLLMVIEPIFELLSHSTAVGDSQAFQSGGEEVADSSPGWDEFSDESYFDFS